MRKRRGEGGDRGGGEERRAEGKMKHCCENYNCTVFSLHKRRLD